MIIKILALLALYLSISINEKCYAKVTSESNSSVYVFIISGNKIVSGVSDSFYNIISGKFHKPERIVYQSRDSISVEPNKVRFKAEYDNIIKKYRGEWEFVSNGVVFQVGYFDSLNYASGEFKLYINSDTSICNYINGTKTGNQTVKSGPVTAHTSYLHDKKDGVEMIYEHEQCTSIANYRKGLLNGVSLIFKIDELGRQYLYKFTKYYDGKVANGYNYSFHPNGRVLVRRFYFNGKILGKVTVFDEKGNKIGRMKNESCKYH